MFGPPRIQVMTATRDGNTHNIRRYHTLGCALKVVDHLSARGHTAFAVDLDDEESGELSDLDLVECGGRYV